MRCFYSQLLFYVDVLPLSFLLFARFQLQHSRGVACLSSGECRSLSTTDSFVRRGCVFGSSHLEPHIVRLEGTSYF